MTYDYRTSDDMTTRLHPYIAIEGVIGVGKTTLARMLAPEFGATPVLEVFQENPFLSDFYADRARYAFQTQIFFLLSRYRQQYQSIPEALARGSVLSDYTFAKDSLFAHLNLTGDELAVYEKLHGALAEKIPTPDLVVYLRADLDVLMARIAARDRPYERSMDRDYIESLRLAYEGFFAAYSQSPVLAIDTNNLNFVQDPVVLASIRERIRTTLGEGTYQQALPQFAPTLRRGRARRARRRQSPPGRLAALAARLRRCARQIGRLAAGFSGIDAIGRRLERGIGRQRRLARQLAARAGRVPGAADATGERRRG